MKKTYMNPEMDVVIFETEDVLVASSVTWFPENDETEMIRP